MRDRANDEKRKLEYKRRAVEYLGGGCLLCGYSECVAALEFHHTDPLTKEANMKDITTNGSWGRVQKELDKCVLLCSSCHHEHHWRLRHKSDTYKPAF